MFFVLVYLDMFVFSFLCCCLPGLPMQYDVAPWFSKCGVRNHRGFWDINFRAGVVCEVKPISIIRIREYFSFPLYWYSHQWCKRNGEHSLGSLGVDQSSGTRVLRVLHHCSVTLTTGEENLVRVSLPSTTMAKTKRVAPPRSWGGCRETGSVTCCQRKWKMLPLLWGTFWLFLYKLKRQQSYELVIALLGVYSREMKTCTRMFISSQHQPRCPATGEWVNCDATMPWKST